MINVSPVHDSLLRLLLALNNITGITANVVKRWICSSEMNRYALGEWNLLMMYLSHKMKHAADYSLRLHLLSTWKECNESKKKKKVTGWRQSKTGVGVAGEWIMQRFTVESAPVLYIYSGFGWDYELCAFAMSAVGVWRIVRLPTRKEKSLLFG